MARFLTARLIIFFFHICLLLLCLDYFSVSDEGISIITTFLASPTQNKNRANKNSPDLDPCRGRYIYMYDLPSRFNNDLLEDCAKKLTKNICPYMENSGLGPQVRSSHGILPNNSWFSTSQFLLEVIFHNRMRKYECLTNNSTSASAIYVPFYAGLDVGRHIWDHNISARDALAFDIVHWLAKRPEWKRRCGRDHFFVAGRIAWDFRRTKKHAWGSNLMSLPESMNMTMLSIESSSWSNEFAIPYPTHFHPSSKIEILEWQERMRNHERRYLFSFAGAPRPGFSHSIRDEIIKQCLASTRICEFLDCSNGKCDDPSEVIKLYQDSEFCLHPPGDSFTRRSTFDSILAGCIPVFFNPHSAYTQYIWHFPKTYTKYSVFIPGSQVQYGNVTINGTLLEVSYEKILSLRDQVLRLIPRIVYADPRSDVENLDDSVSIAVKGILQRVENV